MDSNPEPQDGRRRWIPRASPPTMPIQLIVQSKLALIGFSSEVSGWQKIIFLIYRFADNLLAEIRYKSTLLNNRSLMA